MATSKAGPGARPERVIPGPGQESVWDYPRPPRVEAVPQRVRVLLDGEVVADSNGARRVIETGGPPVYYIPPGDVRLERLDRSRRTTTCEWKGPATYYSYRGPGRAVENLAWSYDQPKPGFEAIRGHVAFYAGLVDEAWVGDERAIPQPGGFYGGWITSWVVGPFKGGPGTFGR
ncbi:MAG TPA: DUF427 domain-containing protein [Gemmatimonadales bacterium]|nr:DUF427 domain-containing protein [Gemmatimonadales bacterium]